jgi:VanZ family protein
MFVLPARAGLLRYLPAVVWAGLIFTLSSFSGDRYPRIDIRFADKGMHALLFLPLGWFLARACAAAGTKEGIRFWSSSLLVAIVIGIIYGATDEIHQIWVPQRVCSFADWTVDSISVVIGAWAWVMAVRLLDRLSSRASARERA